MMGENVLDGLMTQAQWHEVGQNNLATTQQAFQLLDVRQPEEHAKGSIPDSINIPLDQLRQRLSELSKQTPVIAYCQSGQRSYFATRVLNQQGFKAKNLSGAYLTWHQATK
jgi:rhodanese-related sulfurtransferase